MKDPHQIANYKLAPRYPNIRAAMTTITTSGTYPSDTTNTIYYVSSESYSEKDFLTEKLFIENEKKMFLEELLKILMESKKS